MGTYAMRPFAASHHEPAAGGSAPPHYEHALIPAVVTIKKNINSVPSISTIDYNTEMNEATPLTTEYYDTLDSPSYNLEFHRYRYTDTDTDTYLPISFKPIPIPILGFLFYF